MAELDDYFSLVMDNHIAIRNMDRLPSGTSKNSKERHRAYEHNRRATQISEVLAELEKDTNRAGDIHMNLVRILDSLIDMFTREMEGLPDVRDEGKEIKEVMAVLQRICTAAIIVGCEVADDVMQLSFGKMHKAAMELVIETLRMAKQELLDHPFRHKRDAVDFLTKYTFAERAIESGAVLVSSAARKLGWE